MRGVRQFALQHRREAIRGNDVEPDARHGDDPGSFPFVVAGVRVFENVDLAGFLAGGDSDSPHALAAWAGDLSDAMLAEDAEVAERESKNGN